MIDNIIGTILGILATSGGGFVVIRKYAPKIVSLVYDLFKAKVQTDIDKSKLEFENILTQKLKRLESELERKSHAAKVQYDIEVEHYKELSQKLSDCNCSVNQLYHTQIIGDKGIQDKMMQPIQESALTKSNSLMEAIETAAPFIRKEILADMRQYICYFNKLIDIHKRNIYGFQHGSEDDKRDAGELKHKIDACKNRIQDSMRLRLDKLEKIDV